MTIRDANIHDAAGILALLRKEMARYPLKEDRHAAYLHLREIVSGPKHFAQVHVTDEGVVDGTLLTLTSPMLWAQRQSNEVIAWVAHTPMTGVQMFSNYSSWLLDRPAIKRAAVLSDCEHYELKGLRAFGFSRHGDVFLRYR